jgi:dihydrofolate reductase
MIAIAVVDSNWGIGKNGNLLAHLPGDLKYLKETTLGNVVVMGRKTLDSLPGGRPLPGRTTVVLTRDLAYRDRVAEGVLVINSVEELLEYAGEPREKSGKRIYVAGGGSVYRALLPYCNRFLITKMYRTFDADVFFPDLDAEIGVVLSREEPVVTENGIRYRFTEYIRNQR